MERVERGSTDPEMQVIEAICDDILDLFAELKLTEGQVISISTSVIVNAMLEVKRNSKPEAFAAMRKEVLAAMNTVDFEDMPVSRCLN
jgi:hypothetical protein